MALHPMTVPTTLSAVKGTAGLVVALEEAEAGEEAGAEVEDGVEAEAEAQDDRPAI